MTWRSVVLAVPAIRLAYAVLSRRAVPSRSGARRGVHRGAYLVTALAHCGECHTPRNSLGGLRSSLALSGTRDGPDGQAVPNITPDRKTGIGDWETDDIVTLLQTGIAEESSITGAMREAVRDGLHFLTDQDAHAIAAYLQGQQPIAHKVGG